MALRDDLTIAATSLASEYGHPAVELRHLWVTIARRDPELTDLKPALEQALRPRGSSLDRPQVSEEVSRILRGIRSTDDAARALRESVEGAPEISTQQTVGPTASAPQAPGGEPPAMGHPSIGEAATQFPLDVSSSLRELESLVGLEPVKQQVRRLVATLQANSERRLAGLPEVSPGLHLAFTGPPGTGKTTVARIVARLYASVGALPVRNFVEATRTDLVAGFVGQSAGKAADLIRRTIPGVLFIDEAYALAPSHHGDYGGEVLATLVKAMEDQRGQLAVILAGYDEEMSHLLASNPGLRSRIAATIEFPDYTVEGLTQIFVGFASAHSIELGEGVLDRVAQAVAVARAGADFGNGRFVRRLFEDAFAAMSQRAAADGAVSLHEVLQITADDIPMGGTGQRPPRGRLGFV